MLIYNTLSRLKEEFRPLNPPFVTMYMCGPTVYDYFHIGNSRSFIMSDIVRNYLVYKGFKVKFVMNLTDIEDKIIKKSIEKNIPAEEVSQFYTDAFFEDINKLKVKKADIYPKATAHIQEMIELILLLEKKGIAYNVNGDVYYDVKNFDSYGKLSGKKIDELESGARVDVDERKNNSLDFSLWKKAKQSEPSWDSPWGKGRPGWHIECSAMSTKHLGETIDIHAGGNDLIFPHHENEIAQSEGANEKEFVKYWMHFGFLNIQNEKMSKSLGNFFTARDVLARHSVEAIRLFFCQTHYGGPLNFSDELLTAAQKGVDKIINLAERLDNDINKAEVNGSTPIFVFNKFYSDFETVMDDDFNTPQAAAVIFDFVRAANKIIDENPNSCKTFLINLKEFLKKTADEVLGVIHLEDLNKRVSPSLETELINLILNLREDLKKEKNYKLADEVRNKLNELGLIVHDSKTGAVVKRK
ncbi:MAG: cysteinyl-tRNA synthetase [Ignavibacteria bacterium]|nr:MAG: cysteinyl-tRNA synthetase [Ignavibacteria bacterium]KAF0162449.1 MAG: cysteinyl-tRNA synthetase [Ignavibacteria bacterium]